MTYLLECVIGTLAAVGLICILHTVYAIIKSNYTRISCCAALVLYGDGTSPDSERLLLAAQEVRQQYLPGLTIIFAEQHLADGKPVPAEKLAARYGVRYEPYGVRTAYHPHGGREE